MLRALKRWFSASSPDRASESQGPATEEVLRRATMLRGLAQTGILEGRIGEARAHLEAALALRPDDAELHLLAARPALDTGDSESALDHFTLALHYDPGSFEACAGRIEAMRGLGRVPREGDLWADFLRNNPGHSGATYRRARWLYGRWDLDEARALLQPLTEGARVESEACALLGLIEAREYGRFDEGERLLRRALEPDPGWDAGRCNLGWILAESGNYEDGMALLDAVLAGSPQDHEARLMRAHIHLKRGRFEEGWRDFGARHRSPLALPSPFDFPLWNGEPCHGTLLLYAEQGLGDQIMFASCLQEAIERTHRCIIVCHAKLVPLFRRSFPGAIAVEPAGPPVWLERFGTPDAQAPLGDLPGIFRGAEDRFPRHDGYLRADAARVAHWRQRLQELGPGPVAGLSWRGGMPATRTSLRSIPLAELSPLLLTGFRFVSLQYGDSAAERKDFERLTGQKLHHWPEVIEDYDETAALICALDLVVSVCTAVVHLSGALGRPVWVMVPTTPEWRYRDRGETLPWYPSARLYRQAEPGAWGPVVGDIGRDLAARVAMGE